MIRYASKNDFEQIQHLWELCFPDESGFNSYFFEKLFDLSNVLVYEVDGQIAAMTQMIPREIQLSSTEKEQCTYIYGACTHPDYRRKHFMSQLLDRSFILDRSLGRVCSILIPAKPWLFRFYEQFGYRHFFSINTQITEIASEGNCSSLSLLSMESIPQLNALYTERVSHFDAYVVRDDNEWRRQLELFQALGLGCIGLFDPSGIIDAYAFVWKPEEDSVYVQELLYRNDASRVKLLDSIALYANVKTVRWSTASCCSGDRLGCMKCYDDRVISHAYMNLMMN